LGSAMVEVACGDFSTLRNLGATLL